MRASISRAAFFRFSLDRSPSSLCTTGGRGDSVEITGGCWEADVIVDGVCEIDPATKLPVTLTLSEGGGGPGGTLTSSWGRGLGFDVMGRVFGVPSIIEENERSVNAYQL